MPLGERLFASHGKQPFAFQRDVWDAIARGESGLVHATTGSGKTYAVWLGALDAFARGIESGRAKPLTPRRSGRRATSDRPLDHADARAGRRHRARAQRSAERIRIDLDRRYAKRRYERVDASPAGAPPAYCADHHAGKPLAAALACRCARAVRALCMVVVDEWHELIGNKRGVQTQLALARLRAVAAGDGDLGVVGHAG